MIDFAERTAYEMKVSGKNPHHEFYKDIFKVMVYNQHRPTKVSTFVFITERSGAERLRRGLGKAVSDAGSALGFQIDVVHV